MLISSFRAAQYEEVMEDFSNSFFINILVEKLEDIIWRIRRQKILVDINSDAFNINLRKVSEIFGFIFKHKVHRSIKVA